MTGVALVLSASFTHLLGHGHCVGQHCTVTFVQSWLVHQGL